MVYLIIFSEYQNVIVKCENEAQAQEAKPEEGYEILVHDGTSIMVTGTAIIHSDNSISGDVEATDNVEHYIPVAHPPAIAEELD